MESRRPREFVGEMREPEKEEPSRGFEVDMLLAMVEYHRKDGGVASRLLATLLLCCGKTRAWKGDVLDVNTSPPLRRLFPSEGASEVSLAWWCKRNSEKKLSRSRGQRFGRLGATARACFVNPSFAMQPRGAAAATVPTSVRYVQAKYSGCYREPVCTSRARCM